MDPGLRGSQIPTRSFLGNLERRVAGEHPADCRDAVGIERSSVLVGSSPACGPNSPPSERFGTLDVGNQLAETEQDVLVSGQAVDASLLEHLGQRRRASAASGRTVCGYWLASWSIAMARSR